MKSARLSLEGWGRYPVEEARCFRPERMHQVEEICTKSHNIIARGYGRSFNDAALNKNQDVLLNERLNRLLSFDRPTGILECEGGVLLAEIIEFALPKGYFLSVTPSTKYVSVGGAIACDVHGRNHQREGSFASCVDSFELLCANGRVIKCSRSTNSDIFWATVGGMGLTGIIIRVNLHLMPVETGYLNVSYNKCNDLDSLLETFSEQGDEQQQYQVAWIDSVANGKNLGRSIAMHSLHARYVELNEKRQRTPLRPQRKKQHSIPLDMPSFSINSLSVRCFNALYYWKHSNSTRVISYNNFFYPLDRLKNWNVIYGKRGIIRFQCVFPWSIAPVGIKEWLEALQENGHLTSLVTLKAFGAENHSPLSFARSGLSLSVDIPYNKDVLAILQHIHEMLIQRGGRVYFAKDTNLDTKHLELMYPNIEKFYEVKRLIDPQNIFQSSLGRRLGLIPS